MKKTVCLIFYLVISSCIHAQSFQLKYATFEKFLLQKYSITQIQAAMLPTCKVVKKSKSGWTFKTKNFKVWNVDVPWNVDVIMDISSHKVTEIQFVASKEHVNEYEVELKKLGYINVENSLPGLIFDELENARKKLGAKIVPLDELGGSGMMLFRLYRLAATPKAEKGTIPYFERFIISGITPPDTDVQTKYESDYRVIVWNEPLIKGYKYSNEVFDKLGYDFVKNNEGDNQQTSNIYRSCSKGIVIEVTEWYNFKLSIAMQWYAPSVRSQTGYLMYCN